MKKMKRGLSLLLALALVVGYVPVKADAADEWVQMNIYTAENPPKESAGDNVVWVKGGFVGNPICGKEVHQHEKICYPVLAHKCIHMGEHPGWQYSVHREEYCYDTPKPEDITLCTAGNCTQDHWVGQGIVVPSNNGGIYRLGDVSATPTNTQRELAKAIKAKFNADHPDGVSDFWEADAYLDLKWHINRTLLCTHKCNDDCIAWSSTTRYCGKKEHSHKETCYTGSYWYQYADTNNDNVPDKDQKLKMTLVTNGGTLPAAVTSPYEISASKQNWETIMQTTTAPTRAGFGFAGWYADEDLTEKVLTKYVTPPVGEYTFYAGWSLNAPTVELNREGLVLTANASHDVSGVTYTYTWSKDGNPVEGTAKQLTVSEEGTYTVRVTAEKDGIISTAAQKSIAVDHIHVWGYSAKDNAIVATCQKNSSHVETATVVAPTSTGYTGADILASVVYSDEWPGGELTLTHSGDTKNVTDAGVVAKIARGTVEATVAYSIDALEMEVLLATGYNKPYDGQEHGITITGAPENAKITYRVSASDSYREEPFTYKNAGTDVTVYYKVEAANYETATGSADVVITKREVTVKAEDKTIEYGDAAPEMEDFSYRFEGIVTGENPTAVLGGGPMLTCSYEQNDGVGEYTIAVDMSNMKPAEVTPSNYTVKAENGKLTVEPRELEIQWGEAEFTYDGESHKPTATVTNAVGEDEITLTITGAKTNANTEATPKYTAAIENFTVAGGSRNNYKLPEGKTKEFVIKPDAQEKPENLEPKKESVLGKKDGEIAGVTSAMEYRKDGTETYTKVTGNKITGLTAGKYFVRVAAKTNYAASEDAEVIIEAEKTLNLTLPTTQEGYTLAAKDNKTEYDYNDKPELSLTVSDGYTMADNFEMTIKVGQEETKVTKAKLTEVEAGKKYTYTFEENLQKDAEITEVKGIVDVTKPVVRLTLVNGTADDEDGEPFNSMMDKSSVVFTEWYGIGTTVTPADASGNGSTVTYLYYESATAKTAAELDALDEEAWESTTGPVTPSGDGNKIFYFKAVDKAGNESEGYVSTKGFQYDGTAPTLSLGTGTKTFSVPRRVSVEDTNLKTVLINEISQKIEGSDGKDRTKITYRITKDADTKEEKTYEFVAADKAGNTVEATYTVEPMKFLKKGTSWSQGSKKTLDFTVNTILGNYPDVADYGMKFQVKIDSKAIDEKNFTTEVAADGSGTVIKLKPEYLKTLKAGKHKIVVSVIGNKAGSTTTTETLDSTETVEFTVSNNPSTGDTMNLTLWSSTAMLSLMAAAALVLGKKRVK